MKKIKSQADLKRLALSSGARVEIGGKKFNTSMERVQQLAREEDEPQAEPEVVAAPVVEEPKPEPVEVKPADPAPAPPAQPVEENIEIRLDMEPVAQAIQSGNERVVEAIKDSLRQLSVPTKSVEPTSWLFTIRRDTRGFIESVEATPRQ